MSGPLIMDWMVVVMSFSGADSLALLSTFSCQLGDYLVPAPNHRHFSSCCCQLDLLLSLKCLRLSYHSYLAPVTSSSVTDQVASAACCL